MSQNIELALSKIEKQQDLLLKSYWLFVKQHIRIERWDDLFSQYLDRAYPSNPMFTVLEQKKKYKLNNMGFYKIAGNDNLLRALVDYDLDLSKEKLIDVSPGRRKGKLYGTKKETLLRNVSSARNSVRTNLPRDTWDSKSISWFKFYEALLVLARVYVDMDVSFTLEYKNSALHTYKIPVKQKFLDTPDGMTFKNKGRIDDSLILPKDLDRRFENGLSFIVRELFKRHKVTKRKLNVMLEEHISNPRNIYSFTTDSIPNIKTSILNSIFNWNMNLDTFIRAIRILGYTGISIEIMATRRDKEGNTAISTISALRL